MPPTNKNSKKDPMTGGIRIGAPRKRKHTGIVEKVLTQEGSEGKGPDRKQHEVLLQAMKARYPDALENTAVYLGEFDPRESYSRAWKNPRGSAISKGVGLVTRLDDKYGDSAKYESMGPFYDPGSDSVYAPWDAPGAAMHELGHAVDFNTTLFSGKAPKNLVTRQLKGVLRDAYKGSYSVMPLWHEHAAWRKGRKGLLEGGAMSGAKWKDIEPIIRDGAHSKAPALGTYWGGLIGAGVGGVGSALLDSWLRENGYRQGRQFSSLPIALGTVGGIFGGLGVGAMLRNRLKERSVQNAKTKYEALLQEQKRKQEEQGGQTRKGASRALRSGGGAVSELLALRLQHLPN